MINRMACSHRCETDQPTSNETGAATENTSGPDEEPPQLLHALNVVGSWTRLPVCPAIVLRLYAARLKFRADHLITKYVSRTTFRHFHNSVYAHNRVVADCLSPERV
jgi:hypothetical protein